MAASMDWTPVIRTFVTTDQDEAADAILESVKVGTTNLLKLVEDLGAFLTVKDVAQRARATRLLAEAVKGTPHERLSIREAEILVTFFCERLKDHHFVTPHIIKGLLALVQYPALPSTCLSVIFRGIFNEIHVQSLPQMDRRNMLTMVWHALQHRLPDVKDMQSDFVFGFIQAMDGEKDPRNLVIAFKCVVTIATNCNLGVFTEELFEVVACYFPIDFNPPPNDTFGVTKDELVRCLRSCFSASATFGEFALPLLLEKVTSTLSSAKIDAFETLAACAPVYGAAALEEYLGSFWAAIRREVFAASSKALEQSALDSLKILCATLSQHQNDSKLSDYIKEIFQDCKPYLQDPSTRLSIASGTLLEVVALSSRAAACSVLELSLNLLLQSFQIHSSNGDRRIILQVLLPLMKIATISELVGDDFAPVRDKKDDLLSLFVSLFADSSPSLRTYGVAGVIGMVSIKKLISEKECYLIADHLSNLVLGDLDESVRLESVRSLGFMSTQMPHIVLEKVLPSLTSRINKTGIPSNGFASHINNIYLLETISNISAHYQMVAATIPFMVNHLKHLVTESSLPQTEKFTEAKALCNCLLNTCNANISNDQSLDVLRQCLIPQCLWLAIFGALTPTANILTHKDIVELFATIIRTVVQSLPSASDILELVVSVFLEHKLDSLTALTEDLDGTNFKPLSVDSPWQQTQLIKVLTAIVCSAPENESIPRVEELMPLLNKMSCNCEHHVSSLLAAKCFAGIVNKLPPGDLLESIVSSFEGDFEKQLEAVTSAVLSAQQQRFINLWTWICKAVILRSHKKQIHFLEKVLEWLSHPSLAQYAADAFYVVLNEYPDLMALSQHAKVMFLYRQRVFVLTLPQLKDGYQNASADFKQYYLSALSYLLRFVPKEVLKNELAALLPLLLHSLRCEGENVWLASLTTLYDLTFDAPDAMTPHIDDLIPLLMTLVKHKTNMKVRLLSCECLGALTTLPTVHLVKHQPQVVRGLVLTLDDHKRLVRKAAVTARSEWYLL